MNERTLRVLEFGKIVQRLAQHTYFSAGRELALAVAPTSQLDEVRNRLALTSEGRWLTDNRPDTSVAGACDLRPAVERARLSGVLDPTEFLDVKATIAISHRLRAGLSKLTIKTPLLSARAGRLPGLGRLERELARCLNDRGEVLDSASVLLGRLRSDAKIAHQRLMDRLSETMRASAEAGLLQEAIITQRSGRYVLPVKAECRQQVRGLIHDQSASGATVYIEPLATVELNNRLRQLQIEEQHEIRRILTELSKRVGAHSDELTTTVELLAEIDLALAAGRLSAEHRASEPAVSADDPNRVMRLRRARHPLLGGSAVPINLDMSDDRTVVVVTGPNTGGKTVALKTVGLLTLMAQAGLHLPADPESQIPVFRQVFADIGDEQSIEQSLSTFSSHMTQVIEAMNSADGATLILLDEIGAGTDPQEGSALARAVLSYLMTQNSWVVVTTHYGELKVFAHETSGVVNAAVEFDPGTLAPTYELTIGLPGRSNALEIASRLGLKESVVETARTLLGAGHVSLEGLLQRVRGELEAVTSLRQQAVSDQKEVERLQVELADRLAQIEAERLAVIEETRRQTADELDDLRSRIRELRDQVADPRPSVSRLQAGKIVRELTQQLSSLSPAPESDQPGRSNGPQAGDQVMVRNLRQSGVVVAVSADGYTAEVQMGNLRVKAPVSQLERAVVSEGPNYGRKRTGNVVLLSSERHREVPLQMDVRGYRADEVAPVVDRYLNDAFIGGMPYVRIVHGLGSGALRRAVRDHLAHHPIAKSARPADSKDGGEGVTVVEIAV